MENPALDRSVPRFESDIPLGWDKRGDAFQAFSRGALPAEPFFATADDCLMAAMQSSAVQCSSSSRRWHIAAVGGRLRPTKTY